MNKKEKYYNEEEKQLFLDYFIYKGDEVKAQFRQYLENYIKTNGVEVEEHLKKPQVYKGRQPINQLQRNHWVYDTHHMLWDEKTRDNVLTHVLPILLEESHLVLSHYKIVKLLAALENMNKLHPNWNHKNKEGNTPLHLMAKKGHYVLAERLIEEFDLNTDAKNKNGDYYTFMFVHPETKASLNPDWIVEQFNKNLHHFEKISMDKLVELKGNIEALKELELNKPQNPDVKPQYTREQIEKSVEQKYRGLDNFINHYYLKKVVPQIDSNEANEIKKRKI